MFFSQSVVKYARRRNSLAYRWFIELHVLEIKSDDWNSQDNWGYSLFSNEVLITFCINFSCTNFYCSISAFLSTSRISMEKPIGCYKTLTRFAHVYRKHQSTEEVFQILSYYFPSKNFSKTTHANLLLEFSSCSWFCIWCAVFVFQSKIVGVVYIAYVQCQHSYETHRLWIQIPQPAILFLSLHILVNTFLIFISNKKFFFHAKIRNFR